MELRSGRSGAFQHERVGQVRSHRVITWTLTVAFSVIALSWYFCISGNWSVTEVQVNALEFIESREVVSSTFAVIDGGGWKPWNKRTIFLIDEKKIAEELRERLFAETVTVEKSYPNILRLMIEERQRSVVVAAGSQLLNVDTHGLVTGETQGVDADQARLFLNKKSVASIKDKPLILTSLAEPVAEGYQIAASEAVKGWIESYKAFIDAGMKFRYIDLMSPTSTTAGVVTDSGFQVIVDLLAPLEPQIETAMKYLKSKPKDTKINEYIDVRIPGKIYVK